MDFSLYDAVELYHARVNTIHMMYNFYAVAAMATVTVVWTVPHNTNLKTALALAFFGYAVVTGFLIQDYQTHLITIDSAIEQYMDEVPESVPTQLKPAVLTLNPPPVWRAMVGHVALTFAVLGSIAIRPKKLEV